MTSDVEIDDLRGLLARFGLRLKLVADGAPITGSYWGEPEAGIVGRDVYARGDTPLHSVLHEAGHVICMGDERRERLNTDAGGDDLEESSVCYLQVVLSSYLSGVGTTRIMRDMDAWGYSFRLGTTERWFREDADDARGFLEAHGILGADGRPTWSTR